MTTGEGRLILDYLREQRRSLPDLPFDLTPLRPPQTINGLAELYLAGKETVEPDSPWLFEPCFFLLDGLCSIYPVRPFACRSFGSSVNCGNSSEALAPDRYITLTIVINQVLEGLDPGGAWGNLADVLAFLAGQPGTDNYLTSGRLLLNQPVPGLLLLPEEEGEIRLFLEKIGWPELGQPIF